MADITKVYSRNPDVSNWMLGTWTVSTITPESYCSIASHTPIFISCSPCPLLELSELMELCQVFLSKWFKIVFLVIITLSSFLALWSFSTVGDRDGLLTCRSTSVHSGSAPMANSMTPLSHQTPGVWPRTDSACSCLPWSWYPSHVWNWRS